MRMPHGQSSPPKPGCVQCEGVGTRRTLVGQSWSGPVADQSIEDCGIVRTLGVQFPGHVTAASAAGPAIIISARQLAGNELLCSKQHEHTNTHDIHTWDQAVTSAGSSTVMRLNAPVRGQQHDQGEFCTRSIDASQVWRALRSTTEWLGRPRTTRSRTIEGSLRDGANAPREGNPQ